ncbi:hypothetical protein Poli38472_004752 [Pythium oligandrum]|uniref:Uncharacterized protein n=1 Tax=Pythium oligandrum TaxID=41045 RepID=A0A8K1FIF1_PYTOL|nr:hypothetical protein Poli38472_004752 [Pythium oligandrum]|eukprot:TMW59683.1 hypothetical protein Poli38472_004752 [Pythium oligandrum]
MEGVEAVSELLQQGRHIVQTILNADGEFCVTVKRQLDQLELVRSLLEQGKVQPSIAMHKYLHEFEAQLTRFATYQSQSKWYRTCHKSEMERHFRECDVRFQSVTHACGLTADKLILETNKPSHRATSKEQKAASKTRERQPSTCSTVSSSTTELFSSNVKTSGPQAALKSTPFNGDGSHFDVIDQLLSCGNDTSQQRKALSSLDQWIAMHSDENPLKIAHLRVLRPLLQELHEDSEDRRANARNALQIMTKHDKSKALVANNSVIHELVLIMDAETTYAKRIAAADALEVIALASYTSNFNLTAIIPALAQLIRSGNDDQKYRAAKALFKLAHKTTLLTVMCARSCIHLLASLLRTGTFQQCYYAMKTLRSFSKHASARIAVVTALGKDVPTLINEIELAKRDSTAFHSLLMLSVLAIDDDDRRRIGDEGAIPLLLHLIQFSHSDRVRSSAALGLCFVVEVRENQERLLQSDGLDVLIFALKKGGSRQLKAVANVFRSFAVAASADYIQQMIDAGVVSAILKQLDTSPIAEVKCEVASALCVLLRRHDGAVNERVLHELEQMNGAAILARVLRDAESGDARVYTQAMLQDILSASSVAGKALSEQFDLQSQLLSTSEDDLPWLITNIVEELP